MSNLTFCLFGGYMGGMLTLSHFFKLRFSCVHPVRPFFQAPGYLF